METISIYPANVSTALLNARLIGYPTQKPDQFCITLDYLKSLASERTGYPLEIARFGTTDLSTIRPSWDTTPSIELLLNYTDAFEKDLDGFSYANKQKITKPVFRTLKTG